jgi:hypothetical protein
MILLVRFIVCLGMLVLLLFTDHSFARAVELMGELEFQRCPD